MSDYTECKTTVKDGKTKYVDYNENMQGTYNSCKSANDSISVKNPMHIKKGGGKHRKSAKRRQKKSKKTMGGKKRNHKKTTKK